MSDVGDEVRIVEIVQIDVEVTVTLVPPTAEVELRRPASRLGNGSGPRRLLGDSHSLTLSHDRTETHGFVGAVSRLRSCRIARARIGI
jgi:hypothetical protein